MMTGREKTQALIVKWNKAQEKVDDTKRQVEKLLKSMLKTYYKNTKETELYFEFSIPFASDVLQDNAYIGLRFDKKGENIKVIPQYQVLSLKQPADTALKAIVEQVSNKVYDN